MRKQMMALAGSVATIATALVVGAAPALAATTWTVTNGGTNLPFHSVGPVTLKDLRNGDTLICTSAAGTVTIANGSGQSGTNIAQITSIRFTGCTGPFGITFSVTQVNIWDLNAVSYSGGVTTGTISNIDAKLSGTLCTAEVKGTVSATYTNSTGTLKASQDGNLLTVTSAACLGVLGAGDPLAFSGTFQLDNPPYPQVTSP